MKTTIVIVDLASAPLLPELVGCAGRIAAATQNPVGLILTGTGLRDTAQALARQYRLPVLGLELSGRPAGDIQRLPAILAAELSAMAPAHIILPHDTRMLEVAAALAVRLSAACIPAVKQLLIRPDGAIGLVRAVYGGKFDARVDPPEEPTILTLLPGTFRAADLPERAGAAPGTCTLKALAWDQGPMAYKGTLRPEGGGTLSDARVVVAAGRGVGKAAHLELIRRLASLFPNAAVAGSRPVCDQGWLPLAVQVGVTGRSVSPELYLACGISGAPQHIQGMQGAKFVVAVNRDPHAAIFNVADVGVVAELAAFLQAFLQAESGNYSLSEIKFPKARGRR